MRRPSATTLVLIVVLLFVIVVSAMLWTRGHTERSWHFLKLVGAVLFGFAAGYWERENQERGPPERAR
jgi:hypothetical protein